METKDDADGLPLAGEGDHLGSLNRLMSPLPVFPAKALGGLKKGGFRLGSYESEFVGLRVDILKGGGVDRDRPVGETRRLGR